jgi:hypothetical protein
MTTTALFCRTCGKAISEEEKLAIPGRIQCGECMPATEPAAPPSDNAPNPYTAAPPPYGAPYAAATSVSPGLAFLLGLIPGVGAIYNAQYAKGLIHVVVFGLLISIASAGGIGELQPLIGMLIPTWVFYMAFEAYHTARRRQLGEVVDEFSSLVPLRSRTGAFPVAPIVMIAAGALLLLHNLDLLRIGHLFRYWPMLLIGLGIYMLWVRLTNSDSVEPEVSHERR